MNRMVVTSKVGSDGILHLDLAVGLDEANKDVQVTVEPARPTMTQAEWQAYILATAGSIADPTFECLPAKPGAWAEIDAFRARLAATGRDFGDSTEELREDRER